jgi:DNA polymerase III epsilon subunit family exonuclease
MINSHTFIVVDTETTGLEPKLDHLIELAAVKVQNGKIVDTWDSLLNPGVFIPHDSTHITGITTDMLQASPRFKDVMDDFLNFIGEQSVFVAHNLEFDWNFVNQHLRRNERGDLTNASLCTFKLAKKLFPEIPRFGLGALCKQFSIELPEAHRAVHDATATAELLLKFLKTLEQKGVTKLSEIPGIQNLKAAGNPGSIQQGSLF